MNHSTWYIVKRESGHCEILTDNLDGETQSEANPSIVQRWGPFDSPEAAIARRIGLIRASKCQPVQPTP